MFNKFLISLIFLSSIFVTNNTFAEIGKSGRIKEGSTSNLGEYRNSFLKYYLQDARNSRYTITASNKPYQFNKKIKKNEFVSKQLSNSGLISYLLYENGIITVDQKSPVNRLGDMFDDNTQFNSQSVGKSIVSYILGHAICEGFIPSIEHKINDWPLIENTLYHNQRVIDLINMKAGDSSFFKRSKILKDGKNLNKYLVEDLIELYLRGSKPERKIFNYNGFLPNLINTYIYFKVGEENHKKFLKKIFHEKIKTENEVFFLWKPYASKSFRSTFFASRYDFLRIARAMLIDWQNDTCVGKYLKNILKQKANRQTRKKSPFSSAAGYAGFFHTDFKYGFGKLSGNVFGMNGYGGQNIFINFDNGKIVSAHAAHQDYNWKKIIFKAVDK